MVSAIARYGNPFLFETKDLMTLDAHDCTDLPETANIQNIHKIGENQYRDYVSNVLNKGSSSLHDTIKMNNMYIFQKRKLTAAKRKTKIKEVKTGFY